MGKPRRRKGSLLRKQSKKLRFTDTRLIPTPRYYGHFALSLSKQAMHFLSIQPLNTDTPLKQTLSMAPLVSSVSTGFDCISLHA